MIFDDDAFYDGEWKEHYMDGKGILSIDGTRYEGQFVKDQKVYSSNLSFIDRLYYYFYNYHSVEKDTSLIRTKMSIQATFKTACLTDKVNAFGKRVGIFMRATTSTTRNVVRVLISGEKINSSTSGNGMMIDKMAKEYCMTPMGK